MGKPVPRVIDEETTVIRGKQVIENTTLRLRDIDPDSLKVVRKLIGSGYEAYLVGGCVRDLYLRHKPKDFDVATNATPEQIRRLFRNSRIIGRRFTIVHVYFGSKVIETSTFRSPPDAKASDVDNLITVDNVWGTVADDARRRDFTINGLFYDIESGKIVDYVNGKVDLDRGIIRTIGEAALRFEEDPVRMIRAIKFAARLDFTIEPECWESLIAVAPDIVKCSRARVLEEIYKLMRGGASRRSFELLLQAGLLEHIWPSYIALFEPTGKLRRNHEVRGQSCPAAVVWRYLDALDTYILETRQIPSNPVLLALLFAPFIDQETLELGSNPFFERINSWMREPCISLGVARRDREITQEVFDTYRRMLCPPRVRRPKALTNRHNFHDSLLFLSFNVAASGSNGSELEKWRLLFKQRERSPSRSELEASAPRNQRRKKQRRRRYSGSRRHPHSSSRNDSDSRKYNNDD